MRIDGTNNIGPRDLLNDSNSPSKASRAADGVTGSASESERTNESHLQSLIEQAKASEEINSQAVAEAKKLLESGELDSPEAAGRAAENLISFGP